MCGAKIIWDKDRTSSSSVSIFCHLIVVHPLGHEKIIRAYNMNDLWWIRKTQLMDLLHRGGFSVEEINLFEMRAKEENLVSSLALRGAEHKRRNNPDSTEEYESDGDHLLGFESVKNRINDIDNFRNSSVFRGGRTKSLKARHTDYASRRDSYIQDDSVPLNAELRAYIQRKESGKLLKKSEVKNPSTEQIAAYLA